MQIELKDTRAKEETYAIGDVLLLEGGDVVMLCNVEAKLFAVTLDGKFWSKGWDEDWRVDEITPYQVDFVLGGRGLVRKLNVKMVEV